MDRFSGGRAADFTSNEKTIHNTDSKQHSCVLQEKCCSVSGKVGKTKACKAGKNADCVCSETSLYRCPVIKAQVDLM